MRIAVFVREGHGRLQGANGRGRVRAKAMRRLYRPISTGPFVQRPERNGSFWITASGVFFTTGMMAPQNAGT